MDNDIQGYYLGFQDILSPLNQFEIQDLLILDFLKNIHISITTMEISLTLGVFFLLFVKIFSTSSNKLIHNTWSISEETVYTTIHNIVKTQMNFKKGQVYFPFIYSLFWFVLINNLVGMIPYSFACTSHFVLTFSFSFTVVLGATILGFQNHRLEFFSLLVPAGCPLALLPLLVLIEFISYLARNISLGLRLAANILSGHMLLIILAGFTYNIMRNGVLSFFISFVPLSFIIAFSALEFAIAFVQAQVFIVLSCGYTKDGLDLH